LFYFGFLVVAFLIFLLGMFLVRCFKKYRRKMQKKLRSIYRSTVFNGIIISMTLTYLKSFVAFALSMKLVHWSLKSMKLEEKLSLSLTLAIGAQLVL